MDLAADSDFALCRTHFDMALVGQLFKFRDRMTKVLVTMTDSKCMVVIGGESILANLSDPDDL